MNTIYSCVFPQMGPGNCAKYKKHEDFYKEEYEKYVCVCLVAHSCPTLCNPMDCSLPGSFIHGIFQARVLEWGAIERVIGDCKTTSNLYFWSN